MNVLPALPLPNVFIHHSSFIRHSSFIHTHVHTQTRPTPLLCRVGVIMYGCDVQIAESYHALSTSQHWKRDITSTPDEPFTDYTVLNYTFTQTFSLHYSVLRFSL